MLAAKPVVLQIHAMQLGDDKWEASVMLANAEEKRDRLTFSSGRALLVYLEGLLK